MPSASQERFRQSWKLQGLSGEPAQAWLIVRRTIATLLAIGLIVFCGWLIFHFVWVPRTYLAYWSASTYQPLSAGPVKYACDDFAAVEALKGNFAGATLINPSEEKLTKKKLEKNLSELAKLGMRNKDVCIVFVTAHGRVRQNDSVACLFCEPVASDSKKSDSEKPLSEVLEALKNVPGRTKLLILDSGRDELASSIDASDTFPALLAKEVDKAGDPSIWVLTANAPLERSHISAEWSRGVFGYMVSQGLSGKADRNSDGVIEVGELYRFVRDGVAAWVKKATNDGDTQTPQLFHYDPENRSPESVAAQRLMKTPKATDVPEPSVEHVVDEQSESNGGGFGKWIAQRGEDVKENLSLKEESHIFSEMLGLHEHEGHGEHVGGENAHDAHGSVTASEHAGVEHNASQEAKSEIKTDLDAAISRRVLKAWQRAVQLQAPTSLSSPGVIAPTFWREMLNQLLWCDQFCASGFPASAQAPWKQTAKVVRGIDQSLEDFAAYRLPWTIDSSPLEALSFALADQLIAIDPEKQLPKPLTDFVGQYDRLLLLPADTFKDKLNALLGAQKSDIGLANYYEFQLLGLSKDPEVSSELLQQLLRTRRLSERVATSPLCGEGWLQKGIEAADRLRGQGERELLDRTNSNWDKQAPKFLKLAMDGYESVFRDLENVRGAMEQRNATLLRAPDLVHRAILNAGDPEEITAVQKVFACVRGLNEGLSNPANAKITDLERQRKELETANIELEQKSVPHDNSSRIANQLATTLPSPAERAQLLAQLVKAEKEQLNGFEVSKAENEPASTSSPKVGLPDEDRWKRASSEFALQIELAKLAGCDEAELPKLAKSFDGSEFDHVKSLNTARVELSEKVSKTQGAISAGSIGNDQDRKSRIGKLLKMLPQWLLLSSQQLGPIDPKNNLIVHLDQANWYSLLAWNSERFRNAADDAPLKVDRFLRQASTTFYKLATAVPHQPALSQSELPSLSIEAPDEVSLLASPEKTINIKVRSNVSDEKRFWLIAQYNDKWITVDVDSSVYRQHELVPNAEPVKNPAENASPYPLRPDSLNLKETARVSADRPRDYTIKIKRGTDAGGDTKLIVKAVSEDKKDTFVRREIAVNLPGRESLEVTVNASPGLWNAADQTLRPLPNRVQNYSFNIQNRFKIKKNLDVAIVAPSNIPADEDRAVLPTGALKPNAAKERLDEYGPLVPIGPSMAIELPASGKSVRIKLPAEDPRNNPKTNLLAEKPDPEFPGIPLPYGLMILLTDRDTKEVTIRRMDITPQRPTWFLDAEAHYTRANQRLEIIVSANNHDVIPSDGLQIVADVTDVVKQLPQKLTGILKGPDYTAKLYAHVLPTGDQDVTAGVNIDRFPRAFVFKFSRITDWPDLKPASLMQVRIVSPRAGTAFKAPVKSLPITAEVDAPDNSFGKHASESDVQFGVDENQDGEFTGERVETRHSDRQVSLSAKALSADGSLAIGTEVTDFHLNLSPGVASRTVSLLGRLMIKGKVTWGPPVEILLDGSPPIIHAVLPPDRKVEIDDDLVVGVITHQNADEVDLTGIQKVEAVFATDSTKDSQPAKWSEAEPDKDKENAWIVKLSTKGLALGPQTVLVRATDKVGNVSEPLRENVEIIRKRPKTAAAPEKEPAKPDLSNEVTGKVQYGNDAVKAKVELESFSGPQVPATLSDQSGKFTFSKVPPGKYKLKARTPEAIHNQFRTAEMEVTVEPKPKKQAPLAVKLR